MAKKLKFQEQLKDITKNMSSAIKNNDLDKVKKLTNTLESKFKYTKIEPEKFEELMLNNISKQSGLGISEVNRTYNDIKNSVTSDLKELNRLENKIKVESNAVELFAIMIPALIIYFSILILMARVLFGMVSEITKIIKRIGKDIISNTETKWKLFKKVFTFAMIVMTPYFLAKTETITNEAVILVIFTFLTYFIYKFAFYWLKLSLTY